MAKPKLALIPAAQGSKLFSVLPSSGVGDFDFTRSGSATRINSQGLIETVGNGVSRLNYPMIDGKVVGCPHHILEPQRTNSILQSNKFDTTWVAANSTVTPNSVISPSGNLDAWKIQSTVTNSETRVRQSYNFTVGNTITLSCFMKAGTVNFGIVRTYAISGGGRAWFDLLNGTVRTENTGITGKIENYGNGWYRCSITGTINTTGAIDLSPAHADNEYLSDAVGENIYIFGTQLEINSNYPTSYIPTNGSAVTRAAEVATGSGDAATFNDSEGVLMAEISDLADYSGLRTITIGDNSSSNAVSIRIDNANLINMYVNVGGANQCAFTSNVPTSLFNKCLIKYKANDFSAWVNGFKIGVDTSGIIFPSGTLNRLNFDIGYSSTSAFYGKTKQVQYYNSALTDSELEQLTSWTSFSDMAEGQLYTIE